MPSIDALLRMVEKGMVFTTIDFTGSFHQLLLARDFSKYTGFVLPWGVFAYCSMPMGLKTSPEAFQSYMQSILGHLPFVFIYIDDILLMSKSIAQSLEHVSEVLVICAKNKVRINFEKSWFIQWKIKYLGFILSQTGLSPNFAKVESLLAMPPPKTKRQLRGQLGAISFYRRFIPGLADILGPLRGLVYQKN